MRRASTQRRTDPLTVLTAGFDAPIAATITNAYKDIENAYVAGKWKPSELDAGHFVEAARRAIDLEMTGTYVAFGKQLPNLDDRELKRYEQCTGDESYRILIPRVLKAIYSIRNKRGVAHVASISPNEMDATLILYCVKWVLAELLRLKSGLTLADTKRMVDAIVERRFSLIWKEDGLTAISRPGLSAKTCVLLLLYDKSPRPMDELLSLTEYSNPTVFRSLMKELHRGKKLYLDSRGVCRLLPLGLRAAEEAIRKYT